jgi:GcrA cell cycle regulator
MSNILAASWTVERTEALKEMWARGLSATEIARTLRGVTRNAVIGKLSRLGLTGRRTAQQLRTNKAKARRDAKSTPYLTTEKKHFRETPDQKAAKRVERRAAAEQKATAFEAIEVVELAPEQSACAVPFMKLTAHTCRWPLGDPRDLRALRFCGDAPNGHGPYCARHHRMAYARPSQEERAA